MATQTTSATIITIQPRPCEARHGVPFDRAHRRRGVARSTQPVKCCSASSCDPSAFRRINTLPRRSASNLHAEQHSGAAASGMRTKAAPPQRNHNDSQQGFRSHIGTPAPGRDFRHSTIVLVSSTLIFSSGNKRASSLAIPGASRSH